MRMVLKNLESMEIAETHGEKSGIAGEVEHAAGTWSHHGMDGVHGTLSLTLWNRTHV